MRLPPETRLSVAASVAGRLDRYLAEQLQVSRTVAARLIADKRVTVRGQWVRASFQPEPGDEIVVTLPAEVPAPRVLRATPRELTIVYEDDELAVIDKPAGLVVHPAPGHWDDTLLNALVARGMRLAGGDAGRAGLVHRLDKDTSGLLLVAKTARAHDRLAADLAARRIARRYAALVWGHPGAGERRIAAPLARHPQDRKRMHVSPDGRSAATRLVSVARGAAADLVRCTLETGRTHQIRVHCQSVGHPVVGDPVYGGLAPRRGDASRRAAEALAAATPRQALHAAWLALDHPLTGARLDLRSEWPADLLPSLAKAIPDDGLLAAAKPLQYLGFFASDDPA